MSRVQIFIDGKPVIADTGQTILEVCRDQGVEIPTLCHDDQLEPFTSCFLCVVKVEGARTLVPSCGTKVTQGMRVTTNNDQIYSARKMALELILSNHYADCLGPCKLACPAGVDVQGYLALAAMGKYREAVALIKQANPLPTVCGRVCTRPCEMNCRRNLVDETTAIDHVKRFVADVDLESPDRYFPEVRPETGHKVAIIGAGPAGLSCAYYLRQEGHTVDIFDAKPKAGGMLRWGIPQYRLPEEILDKEIEGITGLGVDIHLNKALGRDFTLDDLFDREYEAVFLGLGAQSGTSMRVENEDADGVLSGIDFLEDVKMKRIDSLKGKVGVIGGGNTAMDAARTALRLGADEVSIIYRRTRKEMPANEMEIEEGEEEGIIFKFLTAPVKVILDENNRATGIECVQMELGPPDDSGRRRPIPIPDSNFVIELDWVIAAIGQKPDLAFAAKDSKLVNVAQTRWGTLEIKPEVMETNIPGVFAGGDVVLGPATAIEAIADGKKAAEAIHKFITGEKMELVNKPFISRKENFKKLSPDDFSYVPRVEREKMPVRDPEERKHDWGEIELGFSPDQVHHEALRCLECGCQAFYECDLQKHSTDYQAVQNQYIGDFVDVMPDKSHPFIQIELNKCILCGRCVRVCDEVMGLGVFGFVNRGFDAKIKPALEVPLAQSECISCGQCVETCPTGALIDKVDAVKPGPWVLDKQKTICQYCSVGCTMQAEILGAERIIKISADKDARVNEFGNLCVKGRYGFHYVNDERRIKQPYLRKRGKLQPVSWEEAFKFTARRIRELKQKNAEWAVLASPQSSNEEHFLLQKFARTILGTNNLGSLSNLNEFPEPLLRASMSNTTFDRIETSDFITVCNLDPMETHPVLYIKLQKAVRRGQTVYMAHAPESKLARKAYALPIPPDKKILFLQYLIDMINCSGWYDKILQRTNHPKSPELLASVDGISHKVELAELNLARKEFDQFFKRLVTAKKPLFICNRSQADPELIHWLNSLSFILGQTESFLSVPEASNFQGMLDMGMHPEYLPGYQRVDNPQVNKRFAARWEKEIPAEPGLPAGKVLQAVKNGTVPGLIFWGQDPVGTARVPINRPENSLLIVADMFITETAETADVVFPLLPFAESDGSVTNAEGRVQKFSRALEPENKMPNWKILLELSKYLGYSMKFRSTDEVFAEIVQLVPEYKKEIALFRNGYVPQPQLLKQAKSQRVPYGGNYLEKWFENYFADRKSVAAESEQIPVGESYE